MCKEPEEIAGFTVEDIVWKADVIRSSNLDMLLMHFRQNEAMIPYKISVQFQDGQEVDVKINTPSPGTLIYEVDMELSRGEPIDDGVIMQGDRI